MNYNSLKAYQKAQVTTSREDLLIMLFDGAIKFCESAKQAIDSGDIKKKGKKITEAVAIVHELMNTLNYKVDPDLCANLESLYLFISDELSLGNLHNDKTKLDNSVSILKTLRDGFKEAAEAVKKAG